MPTSSSVSTVVSQLTARFSEYDRIAITLAPEGSRSRREHWKSGFYHLAKQAKVPIALGFLDYNRCEGGFGGLLWPSDDVKADMDVIRAVLGDQKNTEVILGEAWEHDPATRELVLRDGERLAYDKLVIAAGAKTNYFGHEADWAPHAHGLKDLRDAIRIRERVLLAFEAAEREPDPEVRARLMTFVVIGGGPTGVEMAGAISELGRMVLAGDYRRIHPNDIRVVLVEMAPRVLTPFSEELSHDAAIMLKELGVELHLGQRVKQVTEGAVHFEGEKPLEASVIVWASGVKPVSLAERLGVTLDDRGRICVDEHCAVLGHPEIFAVGDIARFVPEGSEQPLPGLAPVAMQQGRHVARQILRDLKRQPREPFRYVDKGQMATIGRAAAIAQVGRWKLKGFFAWLAWCFVHILYLINAILNKIIVRLREPILATMVAHLGVRPGREA